MLPITLVSCGSSCIESLSLDTLLVLPIQGPSSAAAVLVAVPPEKVLASVTILYPSHLNLAHCFVQFSNCCICCSNDSALGSCLSFSCVCSNLSLSTCLGTGLCCHKNAYYNNALLWHSTSALYKASDGLSACLTQPTCSHLLLISHAWALWALMPLPFKLHMDPSLSIYFWKFHT